MTRNSAWKFIAGIFVATGWHPIWREPIGKQRQGDVYSCTGFLKVVKAVECRQWADMSSVRTYKWDIERELWVSCSVISCAPDSRHILEWEFGQETLPGGIEIIDPGGAAWRPTAYGRRE
jgi:hypothetical protein